MLPRHLLDFIRPGMEDVLEPLRMIAQAPGFRRVIPSRGIDFLGRIVKCASANANDVAIHGIAERLPLNDCQLIFEPVELFHYESPFREYSLNTDDTNTSLAQIHDTAQAQSSSRTASLFPSNSAD